MAVLTKTISMRSGVKGGVVWVKARISHPMETGLRKDKKTGKKIPAHYITEVVCEHNGRTVMTCHWGPAVSKNPYLAFRFKGGKKGDAIRLRWIDNKNQGEEVVAKIGEKVRVGKGKA